MNEIIDYLTEVEAESDEEPAKQNQQEEGYTFLAGICTKCLDTGFQHDVQDGVLGVLFTSMENGENGQPTKRLMVCDHGNKLNC